MDIHSDVGLWPILVEIHWAKCIYVFGMGWVCAEIGCRCVGKVVSDNDGGRGSNCPLRIAYWAAGLVG